MKRLLIISIFALMCLGAGAQAPVDYTRMDEGLSRIDLWPEGRIPGSRGLALKDSIVNNRTWRIIKPRMYVFRANVEDHAGAAMLVIPGGGYAKQAYEGAGISFPKWLNTLGITAFVLIHRLPNSPDLEDGSLAPTQDAQRAIRYIRAHADEYGIDPRKVGVIGASSGGHVSACVSSINEDWSAIGDALDAYPFKPDFAILISPVVSMDDDIVNGGSRANLLGARAKDPALKDKFSMEKHVTPSNPPTLFIHAADDTAVPQQNSLRMYNALLENGVKNCSIHVFPFGKHSIGLLHQPGSTALWTDIAEAWLRETEKL